MDSNNIKLFVKNYIKEPILYPLKDIKNIFVGAFILFLCLIVQFMDILRTCTEYPDAISQSIILFLTSLPFSVLIYGYVGLVIKNTLNNNNFLPSWKSLKSIILMGVKINAILLFILFVIFTFYFLKSSSIFYACGDIFYILWVFYYPVGWDDFVIALINLKFIIFSSYTYLLALILVISTTFLLILNAISNGMRNILNLKMIKKLLSVEYFGVLFIVFLYFLISKVMYLIYAYMHATNFNFHLIFTLEHYFILSNFSSESLILGFIRKFLQFYFLVVVGRTLGNYAKKLKI